MWEQLKYFLRFTAKDGLKTVWIERKERKIIVHFILNQYFQFSDGRWDHVIFAVNSEVEI